MVPILKNYNAKRSTALKKLALITPKLGRSYAQARNFDRGPGCHTNVSTLSPWIRHRLLLEEEVVNTVIRAHSFITVEKFVQEIFWRTYWKGWLEMHPEVWPNFKSTCADKLHAWQDDNGFKKALAGKTGIKCFDHWIAELRETHYLHNHARMWFASIWVHTLRLPWTLGADLFLQLLLDGDPASNTLSWRWVAGLQTQGKIYIARAENINKFTGGRFKPYNQLAHEAKPLMKNKPPKVNLLQITTPPKSGIPSILLLHDDDLNPETTRLPLKDVVGIALLNATEKRSLKGVAQNVHDFVEAALKDAVHRLSSTHTMPLCNADVNSILQLAHRTGAKRIIYVYAPVGPTQDTINSLTTQLDAAVNHNRLAIEKCVREWDTECWPHATKGFFNFKKNIPMILANRDIL